jgi:hypothetical protein
MRGAKRREYGVRRLGVALSGQERERCYASLPGSATAADHGDITSLTP